ncbi:MAG: transglycosylase SLT domain-containing protein [Candidatus Aminicenantes bacterium]|nr:MAG: transglycosylase SLT domain-containing protein [Candidatus Aminicenantes bacterium]
MVKHLVLVILVLSSILDKPLLGEVFSTPDNLKNNVAFWKKIYTEISLKEGILHDSEYPLIIYKKIPIGNRKGRSLRNFIRYHKNVIVQTLKSMVRKRSILWTSTEQEIADLFRQYADMEELKTAWKRVRFQQGQRERYLEGLERSGAYMAFIRLMFKIYNIPDRIAYLPHVESSFNINAYSRVGAAGMWQFMRRTARLFNLKIDYLIDERRDPIKSTIAAASLLKKNYSELKSWPLAITAYNHGLASIKQAVKVTGSKDIDVIIEKYKNRRFRFASKNFYSCFLAASEIAANAEKYFSNINYHPPFQYYEVRLDNYLRPKTLEKYLGIPQDLLKELNPSLRSIVFSRQLPIPQGYKLRIPASLSPQEAKEKLAAIPASEKKSTPQIQHYYAVKRGDTLSGISRRFRVSIDSLLFANKISSKNRIYIGQVLRIPGIGGSSGSSASSKPDKSKTGKKSIQPKPTVTAAASTPKPQPKPVESPAVKLAALKETTNDVALEKPKGKTSIEAFDATIYNLEVKLLEGNHYAIATASVDESLGHYAEWLNTPVSKIRRVNRWRRSIRLNQQIKIPLKHQLSSLEQFKDRRLEYHMAQEEDFYSQYQVVEVKARTIRYGDTLWSICNRDEEIPIWLLMKYNPDIDLGKLKTNTRLSIPVIAPKNNENKLN